MTNTSDRLSSLASIPYLSGDDVKHIAQKFGTPTFVYDQNSLEHQAQLALNFPNAYGVTARYAMKACSSGAVVRVLDKAGLHIDASSAYEVERALKLGIAPEKIQLTSQQLPDNLKEFIDQGVLFNACSISQIRRFGEVSPGSSLSVRINPGAGSGHNNRTNTGGLSTSFGIWHEHIEEVLSVADEYGLRFNRMHTHIGSGSDPEVWKRIALMSLNICTLFPDTAILSLGGGYKVGRVSGEKTTDLQKIGIPIVEAFESIAAKTGRKLQLEIEPGTFLVANTCALIASVIDTVNTGREGYQFIKTDTGMTEILRPALYGAQHPIEVVPSTDDDRGFSEYIVIGHCCESSDMLTPFPGDPEKLQPRSLLKASIGDSIAIGGVGAYCSSMSTKNYNSFPEAAEVMIMKNGAIELIRQRQTLDQIIQNERIPDFL